MTAETVYNSSPVERWAYFLQNADQLSYDEVCCLFPDEEFAEAAGVLEMISQTPEQLTFYNARLKFQRDQEASLAQATLEGEAIGEARGEARGRITILQELLGLRPSTAEELAGYDASQLNNMADELQHQLRSRGQ